ncbi:uncharacterized protein LOC119316626 [Triticum dicoccoides]|uniref:uncharacterized protein LOC119316626 n=1 Tax=Triticum dicoccoides TaxID=85692 RepID=UPI001890B78B|nr:uncharacterized protein LOC119316626 [Triticum dicoccoides]
MDHLTPEGEAIYETITQASEVAHLRHQKELDALIVKIVGSAVEAAVSRSVGAVVDKAVEAAMETVVNDLQAYTNGAEAELLKQIQDLRIAKGTSFRTREMEGCERSPKGPPDAGVTGLRASTQVRGT